jgi:hypothetical protein
MRRVLIESPYAGDVPVNVEYALACVWDSLLRGEAPFASHLFYTSVLDDSIPAQRERGIAAGLHWGAVADVTAVYLDLGISPGMTRGIEAAQAAGRPIEYRRLQAYRHRAPAADAEPLPSRA